MYCMPFLHIRMVNGSVVHYLACEYHLGGGGRAKGGICPPPWKFIFQWLTEYFAKLDTCKYSYSSTLSVPYVHNFLQARHL